VTSEIIGSELIHLLCCQMATMLGMPDINTDEMTKKLEEILPVIKQVNEQFKNPVSDELLCCVV